MKKLFESKKKAVISAIVILAIIAVGAVFAIGAVAENTSIGAEKAQNFAFADANVDPVNAQNVKTEFDFSDGQFVYDVEFDYNGQEYDYLIKASDGSVVKKNVEIEDVEERIETTSAETTKSDTTEAAKESTVKENAGKETKAEKNNTTSVKSSETKASTSSNSEDANYIGIEKAKEIALKDAGFEESAVTFIEEKFDGDDRIKKYDIEFVNSGKEYDYEINASTGKIIEKSIEKADIAPTTKKESTQTALSESNKNYIGIDKAKSIALENAGKTDSEVSFSKAKLDKDNGKTVYEVEFYADRVEYDYEIDAYTGAIIDYDIDRD